MRFLNPLAICIIIVISTAAALGQKETPPVGGKAKPFIFPKQVVYTLDNGMRVTLVEYGSVPKVAIQANLRVGTLDEPATQRSIADMAASLLKEGTMSRSAEQIAREAAEMGGSVFSAVGTDETTVGGEVLSEFDTRFIGLMSDVLLHPKFDAADLEKLRTNKIQEMAINRAQAGTIAWEAFRKAVFGEHPYGTVFPTESDLKSYSISDVRAFYYNQYGAARTHLYVVGQFDAAKVRAAIEKAFGNWKKGPDPIRNPPQVHATRSLTVLDRPGAPQSTIYLGTPAISPSDPDYIKFVVMDALLGGSFGSRITANIRENKGYTYSPSSFIWNKYKTGYWVEAADVTTEFTGASIKEILYEIDRLKNEPPTDAELQSIKNYLVGIYVLQNSTRTGVIGQLDNVEYNQLSPGYIDSYVQSIAAVKPSDVSDMVKRYLLRDKMTIVVVGDKSKITAQLKPYSSE